MIAKGSMRVLIFFLITSFLLCAALLVQSEPPKKPAVQKIKLAQLGWLSGSWRMDGGSEVLYEIWDCSDTAVYRGSGLTVKIDRATQARDSSLGELMRIEPTDTGLFFVAMVQHNASEVAFRLVRMDSTGAVFENPAHDFPTRIIYRPQGNDSLYARIEGKRGDKEMGIDYRYARMNGAAGKD